MIRQLIFSRQRVLILVAPVTMTVLFAGPALSQTAVTAPDIQNRVTTFVAPTGNSSASAISAPQVFNIVPEGGGGDTTVIAPTLSLSFTWVDNNYPAQEPAPVIYCPVAVELEKAAQTLVPLGCNPLILDRGQVRK